MLTYQDVITVNLRPLVTAAKDWDGVADGFDELATLYRSKVESVANDGVWVGMSAAAASDRFAATRKEFEAGQTQARAFASILRDAHEQFLGLVKHVRELTDEARTKNLTIDTEGRAHYDFDKLTLYRNDPDYDKWVHDAGQLEEDWTRSIKQAVQAVDDADQGVKIALHDAAGIKSGLFGTIAESVWGGGFNAIAVGDIEVVEAREAERYAKRILGGDELTEGDLAAYQRLMRDNGGDKVFSQTMLNSLGLDNTLKLSNKIYDLAHFDDTQDKRAYLSINSGLAHSLATATRVPEFKDANGKALRYGTNAYQQAFNSWKRTPASDFYLKCRQDLNEIGDDKYELKVAGEKVDIGQGAGQGVRGYQSLATLIQQGDGYSAQFIADITDDMIAMEKKDPDIWDLRGSFSGKDGWFANDPVDGTLSVLSRDPDGATGYLDPGRPEGRERLHYLLDEGGRDWDLVDNYEYRKVEVTTADSADADNRHGLARVIEAAATGHPPLREGEPGSAPGPHTPAQARVMQETINVLDMGTDKENPKAQGEGLPENLRKGLGRSLADYVEDTHHILAERGSKHGSPSGMDHIWNEGGDAGITVGKDSLIRVMRGISGDDQSYALLYDSHRNYTMQELAEAPSAGGEGHERWKNPASDAGAVLGAMNSIGADVIYDERDGEVGKINDTARYAYHSIGAPVTAIPVVGDSAQRLVDAITYEWSKDVISTAEAKAKEENTDNYSSGVTGAYALIDQWAESRGVNIKDDENRENDPNWDAWQAMRREAKQSYTSSRSDAAAYLDWD
ncbi:hypothetical protein [Streptomyces pacificus]|uniref:Uncharacterized protein n=1 Tax=Streptomyces pacificus TaxID=2705029 RepID=A0A6A0AXS7_9ACTN|nr:hypothetical protein [Streptomyces pacificus]GFH37235.1 hypothetical protein SCWH03_34710 [Streptomyces pacificus]